MLRQLIFSFLACAAMGVHAQNASALDTSTASGGDDIVTFANWADDNPVDLDHIGWDDGMFIEQPANTLYPSGDLLQEEAPSPFAPLAGALDKDPFFLDARFNTGSIYGDRFGANHNDTTDKYGKRVLTLSNGHVLTVALVPKLGATTNPTTAVQRNIGMVRYSDKGVKQKWTNAASVFTDSTKSYYVFPNTDVADANGNYTSIDDVKEYKGYIYVLATRREANADTTARVLRFSLTSSAWAWKSVFTSTSLEYGVGLHLYKQGTTDKLTVVARRYINSSPPAKWETWMAGYVVAASPAFTVDTTFGVNGTKDATWCDTCIPMKVAAGKGGITYILGDYRWGEAGTTDRDLYVTKHDRNGYRFASFASDGIKTFYFDQSGTDKVDYAQGIAVGVGPGPSFNDEIYALGHTSQTCSTKSATLLKFNHLGVNDATFGTSGKVVFGGGGTGSGPLLCYTTYSTTPRDIALNGGRLAVAGHNTRNSIVIVGQPPTHSGPSLDIIDSKSGNVSDSRLLKPTGVEIGADATSSQFESVTAVSNDSFYLVGTVRDTLHNTKNLPITARVRADRIFGHGMEK